MESEISLYFVAVFYILSGLSFLFLAAGFYGMFNSLRRGVGPVKRPPPTLPHSLF